MQNNSYEFDYYQYKKNLHKPTTFVLPILITLIILLLGLAIYLKPIKTHNIEYYFVEIDNYQNYNQAQTLSTELQANGAAGFIYYDKTYHVLANFYSEKKQAESVAENIKINYPNCEVYTLKCKDFKILNNLTKNQNSSINNLSITIKKLINDLSILSIKYDKKEVSFNQLSTSLNDIYENFNNTSIEFFEQFKTNSKYNAIKENILNIEKVLYDLNNLNQNDIKNQFKYKNIDIVVNYCSFLSFF